MLPWLKLFQKAAYVVGNLFEQLLYRENICDLKNLNKLAFVLRQCLKN